MFKNSIEYVSNLISSARVQLGYFGASILLLMEKGLGFEPGRNVTIHFCAPRYNAAILADEIRLDNFLSGREKYMPEGNTQ